MHKTLDFQFFLKNHCSGTLSPHICPKITTFPTTPQDRLASVTWQRLVNCFIRILMFTVIMNVNRNLTIQSGMSVFLSVFVPPTQCSIPNSLTRNWTHSPCTGRKSLHQLDHQGSPEVRIFLTVFKGDSDCPQVNLVVSCRIKILIQSYDSKVQFPLLTLLLNIMGRSITQIQVTLIMQFLKRTGTSMVATWVVSCRISGMAQFLCLP